MVGRRISTCRWSSGSTPAYLPDFSCGEITTPKAAFLPGGPGEQFALYPAGLVLALALYPVSLCEMNGVPPTPARSSFAR